MKKLLLIFLVLFSGFLTFGQTLENDKAALLLLYNSTGGSTQWKIRTGWDSPSSPEYQSPCGWYGITCANNRVTEINLAGNHLVGPLPNEIGNLSALKSLNLRGEINGSQGFPLISGAIPTSLGNLTNLEYLDLGVAAFTGTIPASLGNLTKLTHLDLGYIPFDESIDPYGALTGSIPTALGNLTGLKYLDLSLQSLSGNIPPQLGQLVNIEYLNLAKNNSFQGTIPASFNNLTKLTYLDLSYISFFSRQQKWGDLGGPIPDLTGIPVSAVVDINGNSFNFSGMPENVSRLDRYDNQKMLTFFDNVPLRTFRDLPQGFQIQGAGGATPDNTYKWYKDNQLIATVIGNQYLSTGAYGLGTYRVEVTNRFVPGLTLVSQDYVADFQAYPVTLISFSGENKPEGNSLTWKTSVEVNNKGFEIEKSIDAKSFETIGFVDGNGDSNSKQVYEFLDTKPNSKSYYRLKQLDWDGKFEYSRLVVVKKGAEAVSLFPNPATSQLFVEGLEKEENVVIRNLVGYELSNQKISPGQPIATSKLANGIYLIQIGEDVRKIVIQQ